VAGEWETEIVREPAVINAYLKKRQIIEEEAQLTNTLAPTGDVDKDTRAKKRYAVFDSRCNQYSPLMDLFQAGRRNCKDEEEPGTTPAQEECQTG
jgi:hypothetical protein